MPDIDFLVNALEVPNVVKQSVVEHLDYEFDEGKHFRLMWHQLRFGFRSEESELGFAFFFEMFERTTEPVHVFE